MNTPSTLTLQTASDLMNIHTKTALGLIARGELPACKVGRAYVILYKDVMTYIERLVVRQTAERMGGVPLRRGRKALTVV